MLFHEPLFIFVLLPLAMFLANLAQCATARLLVISSLSLVYYGLVAPAHFGLLVAICVANMIALTVFRQLPRAAPFSAIARIVAVLNLIPLAIIKYHPAQIADESTSLVIQGLVIPLGISFYTFQIVLFWLRGDYRRVDANPISLLAFISFFPQLALGPIQRFGEIVPQLRRPRPRLEWQVLGLATLAIALVKKRVLAEGLVDVVAGYREVLEAGGALTSFDAWVYMLANTAYIYLDFSAYADIAVGLGLLFGIRLIDGFRSPFRADTVADFWRRWNVTLMRFFREAIYRPVSKTLGGAGLGTTAGLFLVMIACGLWHGAGWHYVIWGAWVGLWIWSERLLKPALARMTLALRRIWVLLAFLLPLTVFLHADLAHSVMLLHRMSEISNWTTLPAHIHSHLPSAFQVWAGDPVDQEFKLSSYELGWLILVWLIIWVTPSTAQIRHQLHRFVRCDLRMRRCKCLAAGAIAGVAGACVVQSRAPHFFYFQF